MDAFAGRRQLCVGVHTGDDILCPLTELTVCRNAVVQVYGTDITKDPDAKAVVAVALQNEMGVGKGTEGLRVIAGAKLSGVGVIGALRLVSAPVHVPPDAEFAVLPKALGNVYDYHALHLPIHMLVGIDRSDAEMSAALFLLGSRGVFLLFGALLGGLQLLGKGRLALLQ